MEQTFIVKRINGQWMVEGDCIDMEWPLTLDDVHRLLNVSAEQMLYNEENKRVR